MKYAARYLFTFKSVGNITGIPIKSKHFQAKIIWYWDYFMDLLDMIVRMNTLCLKSLQSKRYTSKRTNKNELCCSHQCAEQ